MRIAVLIPGIMGSTLYYPRADGSRHYIWTDDFQANYGALLSHPAALNWTGRVAAGDVIETVRCTFLHLPIMPLWRRVLELLAGHPEFSLPERVFKVGYDWRRSVVESGQDLPSWIDGHLAMHFPDVSPHDVSMTFLTHSMGGLVVRAALGVGSLQPARVDRIVHIGSPLEGAPDAFYAAYKGDRLPLLKTRARIQGKNTAQFWRALKSSIQTFPSIYQLMPLPANEFLSCSPSRRFSPFGTTRPSYLPPEHVSAATRCHTVMDDANASIRANCIPVYTVVTESHNQDKTDMTYRVREIAGPVRGYEIEEIIGSTWLGDGTVLADFCCW